MIIEFLKRSNRARHRHIIALAIPAMFALIAEPLLGIVDTALVGHLGVAELGALAVVTSLLGAVIWLFSFFLSATTANIALFSGESDEASAARYFQQSLLLAAAVGMVVALLGLACEDLAFDLMGADSGLRALAGDYYRIRLAGIPFSLTAFVSTGYLRGVQDMKTPMVIALLVNLMNALLDAILIYGIPPLFDGWGLPGAALATVFCQFLFCVWSLSVVLRRHPVQLTGGGLFNFDRALLGRMFTVNRHLFMRTAFLLGCFVMATALATRMGKYVLGAHQVGMQLVLFLALALDSFAIAAQTLCGNLKGKGEFEELHLNARLMIVWGFLLSAVFGVTLWLGARPIIALFTHDPALVKAISIIMPFVIFLQAANGVNFVLDGVLMGVLDTRFLMIQLFIAGPLIFFPLAALAYFYSWGLIGLWSALTTFFTVRFVMNSWRFWSRTYVGVQPPASIR